MQDLILYFLRKTMSRNRAWHYSCSEVNLFVSNLKTQYEIELTISIIYLWTFIMHILYKDFILENYMHRSELATQKYWISPKNCLTINLRPWIKTISLIAYSMSFIWTLSNLMHKICHQTKLEINNWIKFVIIYILLKIACLAYPDRE